MSERIKVGPPPPRSFDSHVETAQVTRKGTERKGAGLFRRTISKIIHFDTRLKSLLIGALPFCVVLICWQLLGADTGPRSVFLPTPTSVIRALWELFTTQSFLVDIGASIYRVTAGFLLAAVVSVPLGLLAGSVRFLDRLIQPINDFTRYLPVPSLIPLTILWVGIGDAEKILIIFLGTVFQVIPLVADAAANVPSNLIDLGRTSGASKSKILTKVVVPWCLPTIYDQLRVALGWAWGYLVIAELVAATSGIGHVIIQAQRYIQTSRVMAGIVSIGMIGLFFDLCFKFPKKRIFPWL
jgi:NitT/TauT family transport system permease protein